MDIYYNLFFIKYQELINKNIKNLRLKSNLTQEEFAERIGISVVGLSNLERNRYQPSADTIDKICEAFKITPLELLISETNSKESFIKNIVALLNNCSNKNLKKIYEIIKIIQL